MNITAIVAMVVLTLIVMISLWCALWMGLSLGLAQHYGLDAKATGRAAWLGIFLGPLGLLIVFLNGRHARHARLIEATA